MKSYPDSDIITNIIYEDYPDAYANLIGSSVYPRIVGTVKFYQLNNKGILIKAEFFNLPAYTPAGIPAFYGFHIHENADCSDDFSKTGNHYNPKKQPHPYHAGDMPPLISENGYAFMIFYAPHLKLSDVIGKSVIVHDHSDDFTSQPSGNSGNKIACGVIVYAD